MKLLLLALLLPLSLTAREVLPLWPEGIPGYREGLPPETSAEGRISNVATPTLTFYPASQPTGAAVVICPGGGYRHLSSEKEGSELAAWFNYHGLAAYVLKYRLGNYGHPAPLQDVLRAVRLARTEADARGYRADQIGVVGSSAGGHLASCSGTLFAAPEGRTGANLDAVSARPDFLVLLYPVISLADPLAHPGSRTQLLGEAPTSAQIEALSTHLHVTAQTPPTFLFTTNEDKTVPAENSLLFWQALLRAGVPCELHAYQKGPHGIGMRPGHGPTSDWPQALAGWLRLNGWGR